MTFDFYRAKLNYCGVRLDYYKVKSSYYGLKSYCYRLRFHFCGLISYCFAMWEDFRACGLHNCAAKSYFFWA